MDPEIIDLTDETKIGLKSFNDSKYAPIEDSIIELVANEKTRNYLDKINETNENNEIKSRTNSIDDKYAPIEDEISFNKFTQLKNKNGNNKKNYDFNYSLTDEIKDLDNKLDDNDKFSSIDQQTDKYARMVDEMNSIDDNKYAEIEVTLNETSYRWKNEHHISNEQIDNVNNELSHFLNLTNSNLSSQSNQQLSPNISKVVELVDDDILDLDNELSVLFVVTPEKQDSNSSNQTQKTSRPSSLINSPMLNSPFKASSLINSPVIDSPIAPRLINSPVITSSINSNRLTNLKRNLVDTSFNQEILIGDLDDEQELNPFDVNKRKKKGKARLTDEEKQARQEEKERKKNERAELNKQKEKLKIKEKKLKEANKYLNLRNSSQYCTTTVSQTLINKYLTNEDQLKKQFEENELKLEIDNHSSSALVRWKRILHTRNDQLIADRSVLNLSEILNKEEIEEDQLILIVNKEQFVKMVYNFVLTTDEQPEELFVFNENDQDNISLINFVNKLIDKHKKSMIIIIYNLDAYYRTLKNREHRDFLQVMNDQMITDDQQTNRQRRTNRQSKLPVITRAAVEEAILNTNLELLKNDTAVELKLKIKFQFVENQTELVNLIYNLSQSMADAPYKRWKNAQQGFDWFADADCKSGSVNLKDLPQDVHKLWIKHLLLFDKVSLSIAKSIAQKYPNLMTLKDSYDSLDNVQDKELLLSQIVLNGNRTINSDVSKRIYKFLTETNEDEMLV